MSKKTSTKINLIHKPLVKLNLLEKYSPEMIIFETPKEFEHYLTEHKDELDAMTTIKLNRTYLIRGYRITKLKGVISLRKLGTFANDLDPSESPLHDRVVELEEKVEALTRIIEELTSQSLS